MRRSLVFVLLGITAAAAVHAGGPTFAGNVTSEDVNPDFILLDTDGENWAIEVDEPVARAFAIAHNGGGVHSFVIEDGAAENSLYVEADGQIGIGTSAPIGDLTIVDVNNSGTASIRLVETTGTAQTWDIRASSSSGFQIYDVTDGDRRPLVVRRGGESSLDLGVSSVSMSAGSGRGALFLNSSGARLRGSLTQLSSRNEKADVRQVEPRQILSKVLELPLAHWRYKTEEDEVRHLGPMAEDFFLAFGLGADDTGIPVLDASGVALAAIQGLKAEQDERMANLVREKDQEIASLRDELEQLRQLVLSAADFGNGVAATVRPAQSTAR